MGQGTSVDTSVDLPTDLSQGFFSSCGLDGFVYPPALTDTSGGGGSRGEMSSNKGLIARLCVFLIGYCVFCVCRLVPESKDIRN